MNTETMYIFQPQEGDHQTGWGNSNSQRVGCWIGKESCSQCSLNPAIDFVEILWADILSHFCWTEAQQNVRSELPTSSHRITTESSVLPPLSRTLTGQLFCDSSSICETLTLLPTAWGCFEASLGSVWRESSHLFPLSKNLLYMKF